MVEREHGEGEKQNGGYCEADEIECHRIQNAEKNNGEIRDITGKNSKIKVLIIPTNEELVIARETVELL